METVMLIGRISAYSGLVVAAFLFVHLAAGLFLFITGKISAQELNCSWCLSKSICPSCSQIKK